MLCDAVDDLSGAADGGNEVGPEEVGGEEMVLGAGAGAGEVGVNITKATSGGEEGGPGGVGGEKMCSESELGRNDPEF